MDANLIIIISLLLLTTSMFSDFYVFFALRSSSGQESLMFGFILRYLTVLSTVQTLFGEPEIHEFCEREVFRASCKEDEVVIVSSGRYGRMRESRCITSNFGVMDCYTEVRDLLDVRCSGKRVCETTVATLVPDKSQPCPDDFRSYLEVAYECVKVVHVDQRFCKSSSVIEIRQTSGYLSSLVTEETGCGSYDSPWWLSASPGQKIDVYLLDFGSSLHGNTAAAAGDGTSKTSCHVLVVLKEAFSKTGESKTVCAEPVRERLVYTSQGNVVEARIVQRKHAHKNQQHHHPQFLLRFEAVGCPDLIPPKNGGIQKLKDEAVLWCNDSNPGTNVRQQWRLRCVDNQWVGTNRNCTQAPLVSGSGAFGWMILDNWYSVPLLLILAIALSVGVSMAIVGSVYIRHYRVQRQRSESNRSAMAIRSQRPDYGYGGGLGGGGVSCTGAASGDKRERLGLGGPVGAEETSTTTTTMPFRATSDVDSYLSSENDYYKAWQVQRPPNPAPGSALFPLTSYVLPVGADRAADDQMEHSVDHVYESPKFHKKEAA